MTFYSISRLNFALTKAIKLNFLENYLSMYYYNKKQTFSFLNIYFFLPGTNGNFGNNNKDNIKNSQSDEYFNTMFYKLKKKLFIF